LDLPLQATAAAGEPASQEVHSLLERQGQAASDEFIELPIALGGESFESAVSRGGLSLMPVASRASHRWPFFRLLGVRLAAAFLPTSGVPPITCLVFSSTGSTARSRSRPAAQPRAALGGSR
jgi:hypothetical protein